jgi:hypothetical protein
MRPRIWVCIVGVVIFLAGCSGGFSSKLKTPYVTPTVILPLECEGADCGADSKDVAETSCATPVTEAVKATRIERISVHGRLSLLKSTAPKAECAQLYWARINLDPGSVSPYTLDVRQTDKEKRERETTQPSNPGNSAEGVITKALKARTGHTFRVCVHESRVNGLEFCLPPAVV